MNFKRVQRDKTFHNLIILHVFFTRVELAEFEKTIY